MNKYQEYLLSHIKDNCKGTFLFSDCAPVGESCKDDTYGSYDKTTNCFIIKQDKDITKTVYVLKISQDKCPFVSAVQVRKNNSYIDVPLSEIIIDFNDRIDAIKIKFIKNIADDLEIAITYQEADRQAYNDMQAALQKENTLKRAAIKHSVGESLVNIYFQPCASNYDHTEISLFIPDKTEVKKVGGPHGPVNQENVLSWSLIMKTMVEKEIFFKSITGLSFGRYAYIIKQFDKANNALIETDYTEFYIQRQQPPIIDQGNIVVI